MPMTGRPRLDPRRLQALAFSDAARSRDIGLRTRRDAALSPIANDFVDRHSRTATEWLPGQQSIKKVKWVDK